MRAFFTVIALAASALGYSITGPTNATGWSTSGSNVVTWTKVSSDPANFTIVLSNQSKYPPTSQVLDALVDGSKGSMTVDPPSGGWVAGSGFQVNLVADSEHLDSILAQSQQFTIKESTSSSLSASGSKTTLVVSTPTSNTAIPASSSSGDINPSSTTTPNGAGAVTVSSGFLALAALVGTLLA